MASLRTEDIGRVFQIDLKALRHPGTDCRKHECASIVSYTDFMVVKKNTCLNSQLRISFALKWKYHQLLNRNIIQIPENQVLGSFRPLVPCR